MGVIGELVDPELKKQLRVLGHKVKKGGRGKMRGTVKFYNVKRGWGFVTSDAGEDYFVHWSGIAGRGFRVLHDGEKVSFELDHDPEGRTRAVNVQVLQVATADPVDEEGQPKNNQEVSKRVFT